MDPLSVEGAGRLFQQLNRCLFCCSKLPRSVRKQKSFSVTEFNEVWNHLVPEEEIEFLETPPVCSNCGKILEKLYTALVQLTETTLQIRGTISESGRNGKYSEERFSQLLEDLRGAGVDDKCRRGALCVLEKLGHEEVFEEDYQSWFLEERIDTVEGNDTISTDGDGAEDDTRRSDSDYLPEDDLPDPVKKKSRKVNLGTGRRPKSKRLLEQSKTKLKVDDEDAFSENGNDRSEEDSDFELDVNRPRKKSRWMSMARSYACGLCHENIPLENLGEHIRSHVGDYALPCPNPDCKRVFLTIPELNDHIHKMPHCKCFVIKSLFSCSSCDFKGSNNKTLFKHLIAHHHNTEEVFTCPVANCSMSFSTRQAVQCHLSQHAPIQARKSVPRSSFQKCSLCRQEISQEQMRSHLETIHEIAPDAVMACPQCPYLFSSSQLFLTHAQVHFKQGKALPCPLCDNDTVYESLATLRQHYREEHQPGTRFVCDACPYVSMSSTDLKRHTKSTHQTPRNPNKKSRSRPIKECDQCPKTFKQITDLVAHKIRTHGESHLECDLCGEKFVQPQLLNRHKRAHFGIKLESSRGRKQEGPQIFLCTQCGKEFKAKGILTAHEQFVHGERRKECNVCGRRFRSSGDLKRHQKTRICRNRVTGMISRTTATKYRNLQKDKTGSGAANVCQLCGNEFRDKKELQKHLERIHNEEKLKFVCDVCGRKFKCHNYLKIHQEKNPAICKKTALERFSKSTEVEYERLNETPNDTEEVAIKTESWDTPESSAEPHQF